MDKRAEHQYTEIKEFIHASLAYKRPFDLKLKYNEVIIEIIQYHKLLAAIKKNIFSYEKIQTKFKNNNKNNISCSATKWICIILCIRRIKKR